MFDKKERLSGIELLKIISIMLIVVCHITQTLGQVNESINYQDYVILLGTASKDLQVIVLNIFKQLGLLGNNIFFVCSAWFLVGKTKTAKKKAFDLICTVWSISIIYLIIYIIFYSSGISMKNVIRSLLPTCFGNNWYITCYIIFLFIYPLLNQFISSISQEKHLRIVIFSLSLWVVADYVKGDWFFPSMIILWCTIYFLVAYLKIYCNKIMNNVKVGSILLLVGITGVIAQVVVTNYVGLYILSTFADKVQRWNTNCCPFYLMIAIGGLIVSLQSKTKSRFINYISGLSLFIYLIHENILLRTYTRPAIWQYIYSNYGYSRVLQWDLLFSLLVFALSVLISAIYKETIQKIVVIASNSIYSRLVNIYTKVEKSLIELK